MHWNFPPKKDTWLKWSPVVSNIFYVSILALNQSMLKNESWKTIPPVWPAVHLTPDMSPVNVHSGCRFWAHRHTLCVLLWNLSRNSILNSQHQLELCCSLSLEWLSGKTLWPLVFCSSAEQPSVWRWSRDPEHARLLQATTWGTCFWWCAWHDADFFQAWVFYLWYTE